MSEVSAPYNNIDRSNTIHNVNKLILDGYKVEKDSIFYFLGQINVVGLTISEVGY